MFEAGFTCILSKSLMNTRTKNRQISKEFCRFFLLVLIISIKLKLPKKCVIINIQKRGNSCEEKF